VLVLGCWWRTPMASDVVLTPISYTTALGVYGPIRDVPTRTGDENLRILHTPAGEGQPRAVATAADRGCVELEQQMARSSSRSSTTQCDGEIDVACISSPARAPPQASRVVGDAVGLRVPIDAADAGDLHPRVPASLPKERDEDAEGATIRARNDGHDYIGGHDRNGDARGDHDQVGHAAASNGTHAEPSPTPSSTAMTEDSSGGVSRLESEEIEASTNAKQAGKLVQCFDLVINSIVDYWHRVLLDDFVMTIHSKGRDAAFASLQSSLAEILGPLNVRVKATYQNAHEPRPAVMEDAQERLAEVLSKLNACIINAEAVWLLAGSPRVPLRDGEGRGDPTPPSSTGGPPKLHSREGLSSASALGGECLGGGGQHAADCCPVGLVTPPVLRSEGKSDVMVRRDAISSAAETLASSWPLSEAPTTSRGASSDGVVTETDGVLKAADLSPRRNGMLPAPNRKLGNEVTVLNDAKAPAAETLASSWPSSEAPMTSRGASPGVVVIETDGVLMAANLSSRHNGTLPMPTQELRNDVPVLNNVTSAARETLPSSWAPPESCPTGWRASSGCALTETGVAFAAAGWSLQPNGALPASELAINGVVLNKAILAEAETLAAAVILSAPSTAAMATSRSVGLTVAAMQLEAASVGQRLNGATSTIDMPTIATTIDSAVAKSVWSGRPPGWSQARTASLGRIAALGVALARDGGTGSRRLELQRARGMPFANGRCRAAC